MFSDNPMLTKSIVDSLSLLKRRYKYVLPSLFSYFREINFEDIESLHKLEFSPKFYLYIRGRLDRSLISLLIYLSADKSSIISLKRFHFLDYLSEYTQEIIDLCQVKFSTSLPENFKDKILVYDDAPQLLLEQAWGKIIHIETNVSVPTKNLGDWCYLPLGIHPKTYASSQEKHFSSFRNQKRNIGGFFAGNFDRSLYVSHKNNYLKSQFNKLLRPEVINTIVEGFKAKVILVEDRIHLNHILNNDFSDRFIIVDRSKVLISHEHWLEVISRSNFFICPPGVLYPYCHNIYESMAVGTVPITNYGEWFHPKLEDSINCLTFSDKNSLLQKLDMAFSLRDKELKFLRRSTIEYYDHHLSRNAFLNKLLTASDKNIELFVNSLNSHYYDKIKLDSVAIYS